MTITLDDDTTVTVKGFTIGAVAQLLGCSVQAIRLWEKKGVLPATDFRYAGRDRLYPSDLIDLYRKLLEEQGRLNPNKIRPRPLRMALRVVKFSDGKVREVELYRIGVLAKAAQRTVVTLEQLEQRGVLPETPFRASELGYRLYTEDMIETVSSALEKRYWEIRGDEEWEKFRNEVFQAWKEQGVIGARILKSDEMKAPKPAKKSKPAKKKPSKKK
jgi:DNA-binding transcriptional MerR regulator